MPPLILHLYFYKYNLSSLIHTLSVHDSFYTRYPQIQSLTLNRHRQHQSNHHFNRTTATCEPLLELPSEAPPYPSPSRWKAGTEGYDKSLTLSRGTRWPLTGGVPSEPFISKNTGVERIYITAYQDGSVRIWDATCPILSLILLLEAKIPGIDLNNQSASVSALDFCPTSRSLAVGNECGLVRIYKLQGSTDESNIHIVSQTTCEVLTAQGDGSHCAGVFIFSDLSVQTLAYTHTGQKLAVGFKNGQVRIPESLPCLHDKVVAAAADAAITCANQKKYQDAQAAAAAAKDKLMERQEKLEAKQLASLLDEDPVVMERRSALAKRLELYRNAQAEIDQVAWAK